MNKLVKNFILGVASAMILVTLSVATFSQARREPPALPSPGSTPTPTELESRIISTPRPFNQPMNYSTRSLSERSLKVVDNVNISMCFNEANIKVNGWKRNEVRVFVSDGSNATFKILERNVKTNDPEWIKIVAVADKKHRTSSECMSGSEIEIDVPLNATVNIKGTEVTTSIDSVRRVDLNTVGGDISFPSGRSDHDNLSLVHSGELLGQRLHG